MLSAILNMAYPFYFMDDPIIHLSHLKRAGRAAPRLFCLFEQKAKTAREHSRFGTRNYSFLLRGRGHFSDGQTRCEIHAPCLFLQTPGFVADYGPVGNWWEFSLIYLVAEASRLRAAACPENPPVLPLVQTCQKQMIDLISTLRSAAVASQKNNRFADAVDALALALLQQAKTWAARSARTTAADALDLIRLRLESIRLPTPNLDQLALAHGLSPARFRRLWAERHDTSPAAYNLQWRLREACRLLRSTTLTLAEIASQTGFADPLYFSRCFSTRIGEPPGTYRKRWIIGADKCRLPV